MSTLRNAMNAVADMKYTTELESAITAVVRAVASDGKSIALCNPYSVVSIKRAVNAMVSKGVTSETDATHLILLATALREHFRAGNSE